MPYRYCKTIKRDTKQEVWNWVSCNKYFTSVVDALIYIKTETDLDDEGVVYLDDYVERIKLTNRQFVSDLKETIKLIKE